MKTANEWFLSFMERSGRIDGFVPVKVDDIVAIQADSRKQYDAVHQKQPAQKPKSRGDAPASEMTIRERCAMEAMGDLLWCPDQAERLIAAESVHQADALLAELERSKDGSC